MFETEADVFTADTPQGSISIYRNDKPIADALQRYGEWAGIELEFISQFLPANGVVVDGGCHVGVYSTAMAHGRPGLTVHAFEPEPALYKLACKNLERAQQRSGARLILHNCALGEATGQVFMPKLDFGKPTNAGASQVSKTALEEGIRVEMKSLDALALPPVAFIKLDLEGHEGAALRGAQELIARDKPVIFCEVNHVDGAASIFQALEGKGYEAYFIETDAFNPRNHRGSCDNIFGHAREAALLLLPAGAPAPQRMSAAVVERVRDLNSVAMLLQATPRYGDATPYDRNSARLLHELQQMSQRMAKMELAGPPLAALRSKYEAEFAALQEAHARELNALRTRLAATHAHLAASQSEQQRLSRTTDIEKRIRKHVTEELVRAHPATTHKRPKSQLAWLFGLNSLARTCRLVAMSGLFDRRWYRRNNPDVTALRIHPLVHYLLYGGYEGRKPNPVFDSEYYLTRYSDVRDSGINPLVHYIRQGEAEGRCPSANFDPAVYTEQHIGLKDRRLQFRRSPLRHFLRHGRVSEVVQPSYRPPCPEWSLFEELPRPLNPENAVVDVIVPVYRGYADTFACLYSVLTSHNRTAYELIVIDDCSPEPQISVDLRRLADMGLITLLRNEKNLGFVGTVNRGMELHPGRDVLLLNSDTLVFNDWLDRIRDHAVQPGSKIASVTPFTTNGTICSYPNFCRDNNGLLETDFAHIDMFAAQVNKGQHVDMPTGVGFCMYITRHALAEVGLFDVKTFGTGYGEENDFCMRAIKAGWKNVHALDTFVFHSGETSFADTAATGKKRGYEALLRLHPEYEKYVQDFIAKDPGRFARLALDITRAFGRPVRPLTLCITHAWGGGIERHLQERRALLDKAGRDLLVASPASSGGLVAKLLPAGQGEVLPSSGLGEVHFDKDLEPLCCALQQCGLEAIEVHSAVGWSGKLLPMIKEISERTGVRYSVTLHDFVPVCPQITLINETGRYCGEAGLEQCRQCLQRKSSRAQEIHADWAKVDIEEWRNRYEGLLAGASSLVVPSHDARHRFERYFPGLTFKVQPHIDLLKPTHAVHPAPLREGQVVRVATIGAIGPHKGSRVLQACADDARSRCLPIEFLVIGYTDLPELLKYENVTITGKYEEEDVYRLMSDLGPHLIFLPSVWPETFSYTLSIAMAVDLPTVVFDLGAPAERLEQYPRGLRLPLHLIDAPAAINDELIRFAHRQYSQEQPPVQSV